jgi:hypothetical protein
MLKAILAIRTRKRDRPRIFRNFSENFQNFLKTRPVLSAIIIPAEIIETARQKN